MPAGNVTSLFARKITLSTVGLFSKVVLNTLLASITVRGLPTFLDTLASAERERGRGIVTVANHISVVDDPFSWGVLPTRCLLNPRMVRWSLGAADIMFTNPVFSSFFKHGQVLETFRGQGVYQPAADDAIRLLNEGEWIHLFGEGKVCQPDTYAVDPEDGRAHLLRFKWGVGRILASTAQTPVIIPMWLTGHDTLMPEPRAFPKFLPRFFPNRKSLSVTFGAPIDPGPLDELRARYQRIPGSLVGGAVPAGEEEERRKEVRKEVTALIQRKVEELGWAVAGKRLGKKTLEEADREPAQRG